MKNQTWVSRIGRAWNTLRGVHAHPPSPSPRNQQLWSRYKELRAKYDAARTNDDNRRHWANSDHLSPVAAANPDVRRTIRARARYEALENNCFGRGIVQTLANDTIGRGPALVLKSRTATTEQLVQLMVLQSHFRRWFRRCGLGTTLRTAISSLVVDGEVFAVAGNCPHSPDDVQLHVNLLESDHCQDWARRLDAGHDDGIEYDENGFPLRYHFLDHHPGDPMHGSSYGSSKALPAGQVIHLFRQDRPGQRRGISWLAPGLPLFAMLRRYTLAVIATAETAANHSGVMYADSSQVAPDEDVEPMDTIEFEMRQMITLPIGWKLGQLKAEQPTTTYEMFRNAILGEIARCVNMPFNKSAGDSSKYNYSSGRLDHQTYFGFIDIIRSDLESMLLDRIWNWWIEEAVFIPGIIPDGIGPLDALELTWRWPRQMHIDPQKQAQTDLALWHGGLLSDEEYMESNNIDTEEHYLSLDRQFRRRRQIGMPQAGQVQLPPVLDDPPEDDEGDEDHEAHADHAETDQEANHVS